MKNKIKLKKYIITTCIASICFISLFLILNICEYKIYTSNFNNKIDSIIVLVKEKYPELSDNEIMSIINNKENNHYLELETYNININKDSIIIENNYQFYKFLLLNGFMVFIMILALMYLFLKYDKNKAKDINEITKYIEEINRGNYKLHIDEISEDELSILKNEIYKTTVMLKENAENSLADKIELKKSLEDISHQLKTPLTSILVILDNIIDDPNMEQEIREDFIKDIKREVTNINFLVQSLLKLSRFDSNTISFIKADEKIKDIVDKSLKNVAVTCDLKNISLIVNGDDKATINCDSMWEVEAITNIIKNCVEHSKENSKIDISYEQNNVYSSITIQDFAGGIEKQDLPHIFERFYKGRNASKDSVGIGLALAKTIIENDNGSIIVETDNIGTKFKIKYFGL